MNARTIFLIKEEVDRVKNNLGAAPYMKQRCVTRVARKILLDGPYFYNGMKINPVVKSIGAGIYEIRHEEETP